MEQESGRRGKDSGLIEIGRVNIALVEEAILTLSEIWESYFRGPQTPEDSKTRQKLVNEYLEVIDPEVLNYLSPEDGPSRLAEIRDEARVRVDNERRELTKQEIEKKVSHGMRINQRRNLANQRRGTNPHDIH